MVCQCRGITCSIYHRDSTMDDHFWDKLEAAGIHFSYHHGGWYAGCAFGRYGPYASRADAIADVVQQLLERLHQALAVVEGQPLLLAPYRVNTDPALN